MDLLPTDEQDEIAAQVRSVLAERFDIEAPTTEATWRTCAELGWFGLGVSEAHGGVGYSIVEETLLFEELGAAAAVGPLLGTQIAAHVAAGAAEPELVAAILAGDHRVAVAEARDGGGSDGTVTIIDSVDATLVLRLDSGSASLFEISAVTAAEPLDSIDVLIGIETARLEDPPLVTAIGSAYWNSATLLSAAYLAGIAGAVTAQSTQYAKDRQQFGQPIGGFQAVKHRCADMATRAEAARAQARYAALVVRDGLAGAAFQVHSARVVATAAAIGNAQINIQNHGGIGFTWEHTAHRFLTRARVWSQLIGNQPLHLAATLDAEFGN